SLFNSIDEGFCIIQLLYENGKPVDWLYLEANPTFEKQSGFNPVGKKGSETAGYVEEFRLNFYNNVLQTRQPGRAENYVAAVDRWYSIYAAPLEGSQDLIAVVFDDITERKHQEQRHDYLLKLSDALRSLTDAVQIEETVTRVALASFGCDRCYYSQIEGDRSIICRDAAKEGLPSIAGVYQMSDAPIFKAVVNAGKPFVVQNVNTTDLVDESWRQLCLQLQVVSFIDVPVIKNGIPVGVFCVVQSTPRAWTQNEISLAEETAERTWAAVERAKAEEALRRSEERLQKAFSIDTVGVLFFSLNGEITDANEALKSMTGYTVKELRELTHWNRLTPPEFMEATIKAATELETFGDTAPYEKQFIRKDGSKFWGLFAPRRISGTGKNSACVEFILDITKQKELQQQLKQFTASLEQQVGDRTRDLKRSTDELQKNLTILQQAEDLAQMGSWVYEIETGKFSWSEGMYKLFGLKQGTPVRPETYLDFSIEEDRSVAKRIIKSLKKDHQPFEETMQINRTGDVHLLRIKGSVVSDSEGKPQRLVGVDLDITNIKQAEEKVKETQHWLEQTAQASPDAICIYDLKQKEPVYLNNCLAQWMEITPEELIRIGIDGRLKLIHPDDRLRLLHFNEKLKAAPDHAILTLEYRLLRKDDTLLWVRNRAKVFQRNARGEVTHILSFLQDITEE
ncbi:MAG TPA: PAS domain S-box protein, partial [Flavisolibacter sp.]|nr:PAS domain S-box protein [Flavisolibacter sp.]